MCPIPFDEAVLIPELSSTHTVIHDATPTALVEEDRDRSRSPRQQRSVGVFYCGSCGYSSSPERSHYSRPRPASFPYIATPRRPSRSRSLSPSPIIPMVQPGPPQIGLPPSWCAAPPLGDRPTQVLQQSGPADILTFDYNENIAYAPAAKTYDVRSLSFVLLVCV